MNVRTGVFWMVLGLSLAAALMVSLSASMQQSPDRVVSYAKDVAPVIARYCLPCHAEESQNSSELSLDTYALLMQGGEHGTPVAPGKPDESILIRKLLPDPPFGETMPLKMRRRSAGGAAKKLTEQEIDLLREWIRQGAKSN